METTIKTEDGVRVSVDSWDDGGAWLHLSTMHGTSCVAMTRAEAQQLVAGLLAVLEVTA